MRNFLTPHQLLDVISHRGPIGTPHLLFRLGKDAVALKEIVINGLIAGYESYVPVISRKLSQLTIVLQEPQCTRRLGRDIQGPRRDKDASLDQYPIGYL